MGPLHIFETGYCEYHMRIVLLLTVSALSILPAEANTARDALTAVAADKAAAVNKDQQRRGLGGRRNPEVEAVALVWTVDDIGVVGLRRGLGERPHRERCG